MIPLRLPEPLVAGFLRTCVKPLLGDPFPVKVQRFALAYAGELSMPPFGTRWQAETLGGVPGHVASPRGGALPDAPVILHFHGGAFVAGSPRTHRGMAGYLAKYTGGDVHLPHYALAPERPYPAGREDALATYRALLEQGVAPERLFISGDSAGGAMVTDLAIDIRDLGLPAPAGVIAISPAMSFTFDQPKGWGTTDVFVRKGWGQTAVRLYGRNPEDPAQTGLDRDFSGLPPFLVQYGTKEFLGPDSIVLVDKLRAAGTPVLVYPQSGAFHVLITLVGPMSRAREAARQVADFALANMGGAELSPGAEAEAGSGSSSPAA